MATPEISIMGWLFNPIRIGNTILKCANLIFEVFYLPGQSVDQPGLIGHDAVKLIDREIGVRQLDFQSVDAIFG